MEVGFHTFPSGKKYTYAIIEGKKVFLRNIVFLTTANEKDTCVIVHEWGKPLKGRWEPPKGQVEWKEFEDSNIKPRTKLSESDLQKYMRKGALREMVEESNILPDEVKNVHLLPLSYTQDWPESKVPGAKFIYMFWAGVVHKSIVQTASRRIREIVENPEWKEMLPADLCEKDAIQWWNPTNGWDFIRAGFSKKMTRMYIEYIQTYGI